MTNNGRDATRRGWHPFHIDGLAACSASHFSHCCASVTMKVPAIFLVSFLAIASVPRSSEAFVVRPPHAHASLSSTGSRSRGCRALDAMAATGRCGDQPPSVDPEREAVDLAPRRRQFLAQSIRLAAAGVLGAASAMSSVGIASNAAGAVEDLTMPTEEEQKQQQEVSTFALPPFFASSLFSFEPRCSTPGLRCPLRESSTRFWIRSSPCDAWFGSRAMPFYPAAREDSISL